jgi:hypothetical protein
MRPALSIMLALLLLGACNRASNEAPADAAIAPDCAPPRTCAAEDNEDCQGCFAHIGTCCYGDTNWLAGDGTLDALVSRCNGSPACAACCNECKAMTCDQLKKNDVCPYVP